MAVTAPGSPYVESSDLVANYPGVSESLAERVDLVGVLPFADSTARGTALPSPTDGQYSYLQDTNATEYYNGSAWVAAGVAPGLVHINTTTFSAVSSVSLNEIFSSAYQNYQIILTGQGSVYASTNFRLRVAGTDNSTASSYLIQRLAASGTTVSALEATNTYAEFAELQTNPTAAVMNIFNPAVATPTNAMTQTIVYQRPILIYGATHTQSVAYDGITIYTLSGTITGTIRVYGYKNS